jgi:chromosomal replication initiation ATPase DnaA
VPSADILRRIRHFLDPEPFAEELEQRSEFQMCPGTGQSILTYEAFHEWRQGAVRRILWLYGSPGSGKTFLTSRIATVLSNAHDRHRPRVAFFSSPKAAAKVQGRNSF